MTSPVLRSTLAALACTAALVFASPSLAAMVNLKAELKGSNEVPPNDNKGAGSLTATYDTVSKKLSWKGSTSGLTAPATAAHFHAGESGKNGGVVMDGRDIGTVVFPDADVKFFLEAGAEERGRRRYLELKAKNMDVDPVRITKEIRERDLQDSGRSIAPLRQADDALLIDSSNLDINEVLERMLSAIGKVK